MRIVSLCPSLTELVFDLGRGEGLVGITRYCVHPIEGVAAVEQVGGAKDPDLARIVALAPDVVLMNDEENRREDFESLAAAGLRCVSSLPRDPAGTAAMVRQIGAELGRAGPAEEIARDIEARAERVRRAAEGLPVVRWAYLVWRKPWMTVNGDTFAHSLLTLPGGRNVFAELPKRYPKIQPADLSGADPDLVLLGTEPFPFAARHVAELAELAGLPLERFLIADGEYLSWHGSRTPDGIDYAEGLIRAARGGPRAR